MGVEGVKKALRVKREGEKKLLHCGGKGFVVAGIMAKR